MSSQVANSRILLLFFLIYLALAFGEASAQQSDTTYLVCPTESSCSFMTSGVSNQDSNPFLFYGKVVDQDHPRYNDFLKSFRKFPSATQCWKNTSDTNPNISTSFDFDWSKIRSSEDLEVCLFHLFSSFSDVQVVKRWMTNAGFLIRIETLLHLDNGGTTNSGDRVLAINASMNKASAQSAGANRFFRRFCGWFGKSISLTVHYNSDQKIEHLGVIVIRK